MRLYFYNYKKLAYEDELPPKFGIYWLHYNSDPNSEYLKKRNRYRARNKFPIILDDGHYFMFEVWVFGRNIGFELTFRPIKLQHADNESPEYIKLINDLNGKGQK